MLQRHGVDPARVVLELTEREAVEDMDRLIRAVTACRAAGMRLAADDVGAGNAGLRLLSQLKFDIVKIDLSLVQGGAVRATSQEVVRTLKDLADRWGALVIAEGIETPEQLEFVRSLGIRAGQGYLLGRPAEQPATTAVDLARLPTSSGDWLVDRLRAVPGLTPDPNRTFGGTLTHARSLLDCPDRAGSPCGSSADSEAPLGRFDRQDRRPVAVVMTTDGRRVHMPIGSDPAADVSHPCASSLASGPWWAA